MSKIVTDEETYITESLDFINTNKTSFTPLLTSIAEKMNEDEELIAAMKAMTTDKNSNLKELIVKLTVFEENDSTIINHNDDFTKYVKQCLTIMGIKGSKKIISELLNLVIQDMKANKDLLKAVEKFKEASFKKDSNKKIWKRMVGMLIPPGAVVKITATIYENTTYFKVGEYGNKTTPLTGREILGTVVTRGKLSGYVTGGEFYKRVRLPKEMLRDKSEEIKEFDPETIELYVPNAEGRGVATPAGTPPAVAGEATAEGKAQGKAQGTGTLPPVAQGDAEAPVAATGTPPTGKATSLDDVKVELDGGGQQRLTRKQKNSIGTARKTRTNR